MICPNCGYHAKDTDKFCILCATKLVPEVDAAVENAVEEAAAEAEGAVTRGIDEAAEAAEYAAESAVNEVEEVIVHTEQEAAEAAEEAAEAAEEAAGEIFGQEAPHAPEAPVMPLVPAVPIREEPPKAEPPAAEHTAPAAEPERLSKPLTTWGYLWRIMLFAIPILGMIPLFVMAFASGINKNSKGFARAALIILLVLFVLAVCGAIYALVVFGGDAIVDYVSKVYNSVIGR